MQKEQQHGDGDHQSLFVGPDDPLSGGDVLPGFTVRLRDLMDQLALLTNAEQDIPRP